MSRQDTLPKNYPLITIRVSGKLFEGHLTYLEQLVQSAGECRLWPVLSLANLDDLDWAAVDYLLRGENRSFSLASCPGFIRDWMDREKSGRAAA
jgi:hypothetical protein